LPNWQVSLPPSGGSRRVRASERGARPDKPRERLETASVGNSDVLDGTSAEPVVLEFRLDDRPDRAIATTALQAFEGHFG